MCGSFSLAGSVWLCLIYLIVWSLVFELFVSNYFCLFSKTYELWIWNEQTWRRPTCKRRFLINGMSYNDIGECQSSDCYILENKTNKNTTKLHFACINLADENGAKKRESYKVCHSQYSLIFHQKHCCFCHDSICSRLPTRCIIPS